MRYIVSLAVTAVLLIAYGFFLIRPGANESILQYLLMAVIISGAAFLVPTFSFVLIDVLFARIQDKQPSQLLRSIFSLAVYGVIAALILTLVLEKDIAAVLAASALVTLLIGFALQTTLGNFFAGAALQLQQSFQIGDLIRIGETFGEVEELTWRAIYVRTPEGSLAVIPNNQISNEAVEVYHAGQPIRSSIRFPAPITTPPQEVIDIVVGVISTSPNVSLEQETMVMVTDFDSARASVNYEARYYPKDYSLVVKTDATIKSRVWYAFSRNGIDIPTAIVRDWTDPLSLPFRNNADRPSDVHSRLETITDLSIFTALSLEEKEFLAERVVSLVYCHGEPIKLGKDSDNSMFVVSRGHIKVQLTTTAEVIDELDSGSESGREIRHDHDYRWTSASLKSVINELAYYTGPIARTLVTAAAQRTSDPYRLYRILAQDISDSAGRAAFLRRSPQFPVDELERGTFFEELSLFTGQPPSRTEMEAVGHVELIEVRASVIKDLLSKNSDLAITFSHQIAEHPGWSLLSKVPSGSALEPDTILEQIQNFYDFRI